MNTEDFQDAISETAKPVILSRGLWSNLFTWQDFGRELASEGRDTWLIEITGGPKQDSPSSPNYNYTDLTDYYWPALIAGIQKYTGQNSLDYVGFSNGCRVGLSSLEDYSSSGKNNAGYYFNYTNGQYEYADLSANPVDTFIGVGCPGAFEGNSLFSDCLLEHGDDIQSYFENKGIDHSTMSEFAKRLRIESVVLYPKCFLLGTKLGSNGRISRNLGQNYLDWIKSDQDSQPCASLNLNNFTILYGLNGWAFDNDNDYIVTEEDQLAIFNNIVSNDKEKKSYHLRHNELADNKKVTDKIREKI